MFIYLAASKTLFVFSMQYFLSPAFVKALGLKKKKNPKTICDLNFTGKLNKCLISVQKKWPT